MIVNVISKLVKGFDLCNLRVHLKDNFLIEIFCNNI